MQTSEAINEIAAALAKAQGAFPAIEKNRTVKVKSDKGSYSFSYATLDNIVDGIRKPLSDNGLAYVQAIVSDNANMQCETTLLHASGQWLRTVLPVKFTDGKNSAQALGSAITYAKRYSLTALLGIVADEDDDGNGADGNHIEESQYKTRSPAAPANDAPPERQLTKAQARPEYDRLLKEMQQQQTVSDLARWGKTTKPILDAMPSDWQESLKNEYGEHKRTIEQRAAA